MKKPITINLGINPVVKERAEKALPSINADLMGLEEIKMKLQEGYEDIEKEKCGMYMLFLLGSGEQICHLILNSTIPRLFFIICLKSLLKLRLFIIPQYVTIVVYIIIHKYAFCLLNIP